MTLLLAGAHPIAMQALARAARIGRKFQNPTETTVGGPGMILNVLHQYVTNKEERVPRLALGPFLTDPTAYHHPPQSGLRITWLGHSTMLVEIEKLRVLIDPVWDDRASPLSWAGPKRFFPPPLPLSKLPAIDVVLVSHNHYDHLGRRTIHQLNRLKTRWVTSLGVGRDLVRFGVSPQSITELDWTQSFDLDGKLTIAALPARHFSGRTPWDRFTSLWSSFALHTGSHNIYYGADSGNWNGFSEISRRYGPFDLTMLEIGAYNQLWKDIHMGPDGAVKAFLEMGAHGLLMPIHWGLFDLALHAWNQPIKRIVELADRHGIKLWTPEPGRPTDVICGEELRYCWWKVKQNSDGRFVPPA